MNRTPPKKVRQVLRNEVAFGCPVNGCGNPYLEWHHFDPPWHVREHHEPSGMIALCAEHHRKADAGAYTLDQLSKFKAGTRSRSANVQGRFDWLRNRLLAVVGGNFFYETLTILEFQGQPIIWFERDENGYLLLNLNMLSTTHEERLTLENNFWIGKGNFSDFECPPSGKLIRAEYLGGDMLKVEYFELSSIEDVQKRYPDAGASMWQGSIELPITAVELHFRVGGTEVEFRPRWSRLPGSNTVQNCFFNNCRIGIAFD